MARRSSRTFDIVATAGPNTAVVRQFPAMSDSSGRITVALTSGTANQPKISGLEVVGAIGSALPMPATGLTATAGATGSVTLYWVASPTSGVTYNIYTSTTAGFTPATANLLARNLTALTFTHTGLVAATSYFYHVQAVNAAGGSAYTAQASATTAGCTACTSLLAINAGGPASTTFAADTAFTGGGTYATQVAIPTAGIVNAAPAAVYQSERAGTFAYTLSGLTPGKAYAVRLHFAELYFASPGQRLFNVAINTVPVLSNFDIVATAGGALKPVVEQFATTAGSSGSIVVSFTSGTADQPKLSGIELLTH